ncbi:hypothetical protein GLAREA_08948 [Glarea lozoyensis ATCC 20868]|uniref:Uncharacterized protein n=1 Tax=Glarea lozoyensis (strain ATCC 20868 / MF5171) TaxID=1116229 RepID=S3DGI8_GLAL2|nr:uncharacterized protein GLAREA_08948 [Glarea lozoyensis ATCC 20868]EPE36785.1 hypothetical protein GLAREA_08948 [Glarea lozoyensis ATCC 20868]
MSGPSRVSSETRQVRPHSQSITSPTLSRPWSQQEEIDRFATIPHIRSDISDNVSPISTTHVAKELPPIPPLSAIASTEEPEREVSEPKSESKHEIPEALRIVHPSFSRPQRPRLHINSESDFIDEDARASQIQKRGTVIARKPVAVPGVHVESRRPSSTTPSPHSHQLPRRTVSSDGLGNHTAIDTYGSRRSSRVMSNSFIHWSKVICGYLSLLIPIPFFVLAIGLATLDGKATEQRSNWDVYQNLTKVAGTLFPIAFALMLGRALLKTASYSLERGSTLQKLEQLMGSRTFSGAIGTQLQLRSFNTLGLLIIVLFLLSPVGSQGFLRFIYPSISSKSSITTIPYFTTDSQSQLADSDISTWPATAFSILNSIYIAAVLTPISKKASPLDLWSNIKIPFLSSLPSINTTEYVPIPSDTTIVYVSLVGIPISGLQTGRTTFALESSYLELNCGEPARQTGVFSLTTLQANTSTINETFHGTSADVDINGTAGWSLGLQRFISPLFNATQSIPSPVPKVCPLPQIGSPNPPQPFISAPCALSALGADQIGSSTLLFQATIPSAADGSTIQAFCQMKTVYVESEVLCTGDSLPLACRVTGQRKSLLPHAPELLTPLAFPAVFAQLSKLLPRAFKTTLESRTADPSLLYLINPDPASLIETSVTLNIANITGEILSRRLAQLINTYYMLSQAPTIIPLGGPEAAMMKGYPSLTADVTVSDEFWKINWGWFSVAIAGTLVMFVAGVVAIVLDLKTTNPEFLGTVSSLLLDSKFVEMERKAGEDAWETSVRNKGLRLKMGALGTHMGAPVVVAREDDVVSMRSRVRSMMSSRYN